MARLSRMNAQSKAKVGSLYRSMWGNKPARAWRQLTNSEKDYLIMNQNVKNQTEYRKYMSMFGIKVRK